MAKHIYEKSIRFEIIYNRCNEIPTYIGSFCVKKIDYIRKTKCVGVYRVADMKQIHEFAVKWGEKFRDPNIGYIELVDDYMADDCASLGFKMDCGHAFSEKYGEASNKHDALVRIIDEVTDIPLLGSAIYSQWRYFNHWAYSGAEILQPENRAWFILALDRLEYLSRKNIVQSKL